MNVTLCEVIQIGISAVDVACMMSGGATTDRNFVTLGDQPLVLSAVGE